MDQNVLYSNEVFECYEKLTNNNKLVHIDGIYNSETVKVQSGDSIASNGDFVQKTKTQGPTSLLELTSELTSGEIVLQLTHNTCQYHCIFLVSSFVMYRCLWKQK